MALALSAPLLVRLFWPVHQTDWIRQRRTFLMLQKKRWAKKLWIKTKQRNKKKKRKTNSCKTIITSVSLHFEHVRLQIGNLGRLTTTGGRRIRCWHCAYGIRLIETSGCRWQISRNRIWMRVQWFMRHRRCYGWISILRWLTVCGEIGHFGRWLELFGFLDFAVGVYPFFLVRIPNNLKVGTVEK